MVNQNGRITTSMLTIAELHWENALKFPND